MGVLGQMYIRRTGGRQGASLIALIQLMGPLVVTRCWCGHALLVTSSTGTLSFINFTEE